jgi:hypothetical protein
LQTTALVSRAYLVFNVVGGATGSGIGSLLLKGLFVDYGMKSKLGITVYPHSMSTLMSLSLTMRPMMHFILR